MLLSQAAPHDGHISTYTNMNVLMQELLNLSDGNPQDHKQQKMLHSMKPPDDGMCIHCNSTMWNLILYIL